MDYKCFLIFGVSVIDFLAMEGTIFFKEESQVTLFSLLCFLFVLSIILILFFFFSKKKIIQKELEKKDLDLFHQKKLLEANLLVQEEERKRIGGELHDDISSQLNLMALDLQLLNKPKIEHDDLKKIQQHLLNLIFKANENSRKIAHNLFPPMLEKFGLEAALEELIDDFNFSNIINIHFKSEYDLNLLSPAAQLHIYRIFQELINNSLKHGKANKIEIKILNLNSKINFFYLDDGKGFKPQKLNQKKSGLGLKNIENRIFFLDGTFQLKSQPQEGITFNFSIPEK